MEETPVSCHTQEPTADNLLSDQTEVVKALVPRVYFVYGSLMDPTTLKAVIAARGPPMLRPATISGYHIKMWGRYPALLDSLDSQPPPTIHGMAFEIDRFEHAGRMCQRLQEYEGSKYELVQCLVQFEDDARECVRATTFKWIGHQRELKEGVFDLKDYQMYRLESNNS